MKHSQRVIFALLAALASGFGRAADAPKGERYALLVGVRQYSEAKELRPLPYAENDVTELAQVLKDGGYKPENVVLMTQAAGADHLRFLPLKARVQRELDLLLKNRTDDDTVLLAFAGHGCLSKDGADSYFCPADAQLDDEDTLLSLTTVYRELEGCKAGTKVLLVDACRNDALRDKSRAPAKLDLESATRPPEPARDGAVAAFFSCSRDQKAYEDDRSKHGAFFHYVIEGLRGEAAPDKDSVSLLELGAYVQRRVTDFARAEYGVDQKPELSNASVRGAAAVVLAADYYKAYRRGERLLEQKEYERAEAALSEALRLGPNYAPALRARGRTWYSRNEYDKAIADYDAAIRLDPKDGGAFSNRGAAWWAKKEYDKAIADLDEAIRIDPKDARYFDNRGAAWHSKKQYDKAIADYDEAIRLDPKVASPFNGRGMAWHAKGAYDKAIADYDEAIRLDPKDASIFYNRGAVWVAKRDYDKAITDYGEAIRLDPKDARLFNKRGDVWINKDEYDKAFADFDEAIRLDPKDARAFYNRGAIWTIKKEYDKGIADFDEAIRLQPKYARAFFGRGVALFDKKEYDKTIADCDEAVRLDPTDADVYDLRGRAHEQKGEEEAALDDFTRAQVLRDEALKKMP